MAAAAALRAARVLRSASGPARSLARSVPSPQIPSRLMNVHSFSSKKIDTGKMAQVAEELAKVMKEPPSEATYAKAKALAEELNTFYHPKVEVALQGQSQQINTDKALRELSVKLNKAETANYFIYILASIIGAFVLSETVLVIKMQHSVAHLEDKSKTVDESIVEMKQKIFQLEYHYSAIEPERCLSCMKAQSDLASPLPKARSDLDSPIPKGTQGALASQELPDGFWSWASWKRWIYGADA